MISQIPSDSTNFVGAVYKIKTVFDAPSTFLPKHFTKMLLISFTLFLVSLPLVNSILGYDQSAGAFG